MKYLDGYFSYFDEMYQGTALTQHFIFLMLPKLGVRSLMPHHPSKPTIGIDFLSKTMHLEEKTVRLHVRRTEFTSTQTTQPPF